MPYLFGVDTSTILLKHEGHKLHQTFTVEDNAAFLLFSAELITANKINITVDAVAIGEVTWNTGHAETMALIVTALELLDSIESAEIIGADTLGLKIVAASNDNPFTAITGVVTLGATQATMSATYDQNQLVKGRPVVLNTDGTVAPARVDDSNHEIIGIAIMDAIEFEDVTVMMKAYVIIFCEWKAATSYAGPVTFDAYNAVTGYNEVDDAAVDTTNQWGWALDDGDDGDITRVALL